MQHSTTRPITVGAAKRLLADSDLITLLANHEKTATEAIINSHDLRSDKHDIAVLKVRAIREITRDLTSLAEGKDNPKPKPRV
jgi:hypothetical protein